MNRKIAFITFIAIFLLTPVMGKSRAPVVNKLTVQKRLEALFTLCKAGDFGATAEYWVYRGPDKARKWKDVLNAKDPDEAAEAFEMCKRINYLLENYDGYTFGEYQVEKEYEGAFYILQTIFTKEGKDPKKVYFAFLMVKGKLAIGDIDQ